ncbi:glycosyltransferase [Leptospira sp. GIMC2001]|uniref:glycosyltransferase n=1 Tax=Leptospira sp. GIMC2001 TaxID=1513297 RepID=UPI00234BEA95|nr:glycosyltransferase [Leptospira sp. GIMC2001]WCL49575.1 glycosyltransferase [Leptospira sp. GIMC2001]
MKVYQHVDEFHPYDGIGNDCRGIAKIFNQIGIENYIVTQRNFETDSTNVLDYQDSFKTYNNDIHILHYGGSGYPIEAFTERRGNHFLRFHNITPPEYFRGFNAGVYASMEKFYIKSILELNSLERIVKLSISDSAYNGITLSQFSKIKSTTIPIFRDYKLYERVQSETEDLIFIGRLVPNKKIEDVLFLFKIWNTIYPNSKLNLIGSPVPGLEEYSLYLKDCIEKLKLDENIIFYSKISDEVKAEIIQKSSAFVSMSDHEGFCIPIIEAMEQKIPVFSYSSAAVPETMRYGGVLFGRKDFTRIAELMNIILKDKEKFTSIINSQNRALQYYIDYPFNESLLNALNINHRVKVA